MKMLFVTAAVIASCILLAGADARADKATDLKPTAKLGEKLADDAFDESQLGKAWTVNKGDWKIEEGALVGREKPQDEHAAVLTLKQPNRDSVLRFSFKLDGATAFNLSFNHAKGHLFRISAGGNALTITKDKDKQDPKSKPEVLAKAGGKFTPGEWYTMLVEIQGDKVSVQTDNGLKTSVSHPALDVDKTGYRFVTRGESLLLDDVTAWRIER